MRSDFFFNVINQLENAHERWVLSLLLQLLAVYVLINFFPPLPLPFIAERTFSFNKMQPSSSSLASGKGLTHLKSVVVGVQKRVWIAPSNYFQRLICPSMSIWNLVLRGSNCNYLMLNSKQERLQHSNSSRFSCHWEPLQMSLRCKRLGEREVIAKASECTWEKIW